MAWLSVSKSKRFTFWFKFLLKHINGLHPLFFGLQKVLRQVLQEAGYSKESYLMLNDFIKVIYVFYIILVTVKFIIGKKKIEENKYTWVI